MKILLRICLIIILSMTFTLSFTQAIKKSIELKEKEEFLNSSDYKSIEKQLGFSNADSKKFIEEGTFRSTNTQMGEEFDLGLTTYEIKRKIKSNERAAKPKIEIIIIIRFRDYKTGETMTWVDKENKNFVLSPEGKLIEEIRNRASLSDCLKQYLKPGITSCVQCGNCVSNSCKNLKKWKKISCLINSCGNSCAPCVINLYKFIICCLS